MKLSRSHLQPPRAQFSLSMNVTVFRSASTATCLVAVKGQVAKLFEHVCTQNQRYAVPLAGPASRLCGVSHRLWQRHCEECRFGQCYSSVIFSHLVVHFYFSICCMFFVFYWFSFFSVPFIDFASKSVEACLPNACVCPPVCPTASPKDSSWPIFSPESPVPLVPKIWDSIWPIFSPESSLHQNLFCTIFS